MLTKAPADTLAGRQAGRWDGLGRGGGHVAGREAGSASAEARGSPALKSQGSGRRSLCISLCRPRGTEEAMRPAYRVARSGGRAEGGRGPECAFCVPVKNSTLCERSARCTGLQKPPARRQNVRAMAATCVRRSACLRVPCPDEAFIPGVGQARFS